MTRADFLATFILQNTAMLGVERAIQDGNKAADAIYGEAR